jgi:hypothetical protein
MELPVTPGVQHEVRARAVDLWGRRSAWSTGSTLVAVPPGPVRNVEVTATDSLLVVEFDRPTFTGGRPLSRMTVGYEADFGYKECNVKRELRCEFSSPLYPVRLTLYAVTSHRFGERSSVAVLVDVPDPTP